MRISKAISGAALLATFWATAACNLILGIDGDPELAPDAAQPDAPPDAPPCQVDQRFALITSNPLTSILIRRSSDGGPSMLFKLNNDTLNDALSLLIYDNMGGHGIINTPGSYTVTAADSKLETCGICLVIGVDYDSVAKKYAQTFMAEARGSLVLTKADATGLTGRMRQLKFRRVDNSSGVTKEVADACSVTVDDVVFDLPYTATATAAAMLPAGR